MYRQSIGIVLLIVVFVLISQGASAQSRPDGIPPLDTTKHTVPLQEIYFDTFRSSPPYIRLPDAPQSFIDDIIDAIPPLNNPDYETVDEALWMHEDDVVIGYASGEEAWAFPIRIMNFHEMVNDTLGGEPVAVSYCPLCFCAAVYHRELEGRLLEFGNTNALFESDFVMLDYQTGSYWWQAKGEAIVGELAGKQLTLLPSITTTWSQWVELYPQTLVLSRRTGFVRNYNQDPFESFPAFLDRGNFAFPIWKAGQDDRFPPSTLMLTFAIENQLFALNVEDGEPAAYSAPPEFGSWQVLLDPTVNAGAVYRSQLEGQAIQLTAQDDRWIDSGTGSEWNLAGEAVEGILTGSRLEPLPAKLMMWYQVTALDPDVRLMGQSAIETAVFDYPLYAEKK